MDLVVGLQIMSMRHNVILLVVDKLTNSSHFIQFRDTYGVTDVERVFINEIVHIHGIPRKIIYGKDPKFTSIFWRSMQSALRIQLNLRSSYHVGQNLT